MKDSEFIELLNLYLDQEISAADAVRLEAEVGGNPSRRRIYEDYCRMQKGCKLLAQEFQSEGSTLAEDRKIVAFESARARRRVGYYAAAGFAAAAACVAFIFVSSGGPQNAATVAAPAVAAAPAPTSTERTIGRTVSIPTPREESARLGASLSLSSTAAGQTSPLFVATDSGAARFEWVQTLKLTPLPQISSEPLRYEARPENRTYNSRELLDNNVENIALRFQK